MKANTIKKPIILTEEDKAELKNVKVYKKVHREIKRHLVDNEVSLVEFVSQAIIEKLTK